MTSLKNKTLFITGASRGIGKAIALRAARDGANISVVAKTKDPLPKLPGTVYTSVDDIISAGGKALPNITDIRFEGQIQAAIDATISEFGGIDILINNASAINLSPTLDVSMKRFDLMFSVNARGTFLCSKLCIPHLKKAENPHVLNLSPPLNFIFDAVYKFIHTIIVKLFMILVLKDSSFKFFKLEQPMNGSPEHH